MDTGRGVVATLIALVLVIGAASVAAADRIKTVARLSGGAEVPGPGDPDGKGRAIARLIPGKGKVCYTVRYSAIQQPSAAHIHAGTRDEAGDVVVTLFSQGSPSPIKGCVKTAKSVVRAIGRNPGRYYVNVHNEEFPAGAIRGQLKRAD